MTKLEFKKTVIRFLDDYDSATDADSQMTILADWAEHDPAAAELLEDCFVVRNRLVEYLEKTL